MRDGLLALLGVVAASGCSYDWTVAQGTDAAGDVVSRADAAANMDGTMDAPPDVAGDMTARPDAPDAPEAAPLQPCNTTQESMVQQARAAALVCTGITPAPCMVLVTDECGCPVVAAADDQAEASYVTAIKQIEMSCIPSWCPTGCGPAPMEGLCLVVDAGAGAYACFQ
jgi:hypothetical protein